MWRADWFVPVLPREIAVGVGQLVARVVAYSDSRSLAAAIERAFAPHSTAMQSAREPALSNRSVDRDQESDRTNNRQSLLRPTRTTGIV